MFSLRFNSRRVGDLNIGLWRRHLTHDSSNFSWIVRKVIVLIVKSSRSRLPQRRWRSIHNNGERRNSAACGIGMRMKSVFVSAKKSYSISNDRQKQTYMQFYLIEYQQQSRAECILHLLDESRIGEDPDRTQCRNELLVSCGINSSGKSIDLGFQEILDVNTSLPLCTILDVNSFHRDTSQRHF